MNKKDYIDAMNEIEVSDKVKRATLNKIKEQPKRKIYNKLFPLASLAMMCVVIMALVMPGKTIAPTMLDTKKDEKDDKRVEKVGNLSNIENFEELYAILKENAPEYYYNNSIDMITDDIQESVNGEVSKSINTSSQEDYSKTNVQVEGVDEADIVKTDGRYIYYLKYSKLNIIDTENGNKLLSTANLSFSSSSFYPREIYVKDDKLVVIGTRELEKILSNFTGKYSYSEFTVAKIYDIKDRSNPKEERTVEIEGYYLSSRMINNNLYLISNEYNYNAYICQERDIEELNENDFKPRYKDTAISGDRKHVDFNCIWYIPESDDTSYLNIASFDITKNKEANISSYLGAGSTIYASEDYLFITRPQYNYSEIFKKSTQTTKIFKFGLKDDKCEFLNEGSVPGTILNQFSMDEKDGYFRIATTDRENTSTNNLYVLDKNLDIVGKVEGLAEGERIYSVRFMGTRAYMVTFVETDPLFVIDLKDPKNPKVLGELKIPGYSKYLHPYDDTHIIGFGEDTKVVNYGYGDRVLTDGMKMALFDVTDPENPKEMYNVKIGEKGTYSELLNNHKALLFSKEKNLIAFPVSITEDDYDVTFQGAIVYGLSLEKGFELKGKISNIEDGIARYYGTSNVERILYINDTLYTLSSDLVKATDMNSMKTKGSLKLK